MKLYAGKFETIEELEKSYKALQRRFTIDRQKIALSPAQEALKALSDAERIIKNPTEKTAERKLNCLAGLINSKKYESIILSAELKKD